MATDVNAAGLRGASDWRMSKVKELEGIADIGHLPGDFVLRRHQLQPQGGEVRQCVLRAIFPAALKPGDK